MANTLGEKELKTSYPVVSGIDSDSKHAGRVTHLVAEGYLGVKSTLSKRDSVGL